MSAQYRSEGARREAAFHPAGGFPVCSRVRPTCWQHGPGWHPVAMSLAVALALLGSGEEVAEAPAGTSVSNLRQEEPRPTALCDVSSPGEVFGGLHRWQELCPAQEGGFALLALSLWKQELCWVRRAVRAGRAAVSPAGATCCPRRAVLRAGCFLGSLHN